MSEQGLEVIESSTQKTHQWIGAIAETAHLEKRDAYKALRAVLHALRDRLPLENAVHFAAQFPMFLRGLFYEGWVPSQTPVKMNREEFLAIVQANIVTNQVIDPLHITRAVLSVMTDHVGRPEMEKVKHTFPRDMQTLWPERAGAL